MGAKKGCEVVFRDSLTIVTRPGLLQNVYEMVLRPLAMKTLLELELELEYRWFFRIITIAGSL
jgi:hypothetical protein